MAQLQQAFDATQWDPSQSVGMLPIGRHKVIIESSEIKATNANDGSGKLVLGLRVIEGRSAGSTGDYSLNLYNKSAKACEIAHRELSAICHVIGVYNVQDTAQLHNIPFFADIVQKSPTQEQAAKIANGEQVTIWTEVKKVFDVNGIEPGKKGASQPTQAPQAVPAPVAQPNAQPNFNVSPAGWGEPANATAAQSGTAWAPPAQSAPVPAAQPAQAWQAPPAGGPAPWSPPR